mmetsp:Transcript_59094/g.67288  ORF Transcript_59094/g.67288 Transcript_59094/m.67288 type:complete len:83 (-) Transcript_59094:827-1075(-)
MASPNTIRARSTTFPITTSTDQISYLTPPKLKNPLNRIRSSLSNRENFFFNSVDMKNLRVEPEDMVKIAKEKARTNPCYESI